MRMRSACPVWLDLLPSTVSFASRLPPSPNTHLPISSSFIIIHHHHHHLTQNQPKQLLHNTKHIIMVQHKHIHVTHDQCAEASKHRCSQEKNTKCSTNSNWASVKAPRHSGIHPVFRKKKKDLKEKKTKKKQLNKLDICTI